MTSRLAGPDWRLALITGGAATGKTVVAAEWYHALGNISRTWVCLDAESSQPGVFWAALAAALEKAAPGAFCETARRAQDRRASSRQVLDTVLVEMSALDSELVLVIDDAHVLHRTPTWLELDRLIEYLPPQVRLAMTSRLDPPWPLARWAARSWLVQVRQADLAFTFDETDQFFAARGEQRLTAEDIEDLWRHTEGWVAALDLAAIHIRAQIDASRAAREFSGGNRMVADLIASELIDSQPPEVANFMLRSSILDVLDPEICDAIWSTPSHQLLQHLDATLPFILTMDSSPGYRRYHPLLQEVLRMQLLSQSPEIVKDLRQNLADAYQQRGDLARAMRYLIDANDLESAAELGLEVFLEAYDRGGPHGEIETLLESFKPLDGERSPLVMLAYAFGLSLVQRVPEAAVWLDRAEFQIATNADGLARESVLLDTLRVLLFATTAGYREAVEAGQRALAEVDRGINIGPLGPRCRPALAEVHLLAGDCETARTVLEGAPSGDEIVKLIKAPAIAAHVAAERGCLTDALEFADRACTASEALSMPNHPRLISARLARAEVFIERNQLDEAEKCLKEVDESLTDSPQALAYRVVLATSHARLAVAVGGAEESLVVVDEVRSMLTRARVPLLDRVVDQIDARWSIESGHLHRAARILSTLGDDLSTETLRARLDLAEGRADAAIERIGLLSPTTPREHLRCALLNLRAEAASDRTSSQERAVEVVELAAPEGMARSILEEGPDAARLVRSAAETSDLPMASRFACALGSPMTVRTPPRIVSDLSERERSVLRFLPTRLTNQEIGSETFMSVNTVKTHLKHIYVKLNVTSRADAVDRAKVLGLI